MNPTILIIDDDEKLNLLLKDFFKDFGFTTLTATHPEDGLKIIKQKSPDIIILDVMLPGMNGFEVCKTVRKFSSIPIIMLTAKGELMDRVVGLELGADDYLAKPFEPRELVARIQSVLRRIHPVEKNQVRKFGSMVVDFNKHTVEVDGKNIEMTTNEFLALCLLARNPNKVLNRDQILDEMSGIECDAFNRSVDITMSRLRQKLNDDPKNPSFIKTIWGTGYMFVAEEKKDEE
jgi:DNA-binding response OmpR family regulator